MIPRANNILLENSQCERISRAIFAKILSLLNIYQEYTKSLIKSCIIILKNKVQ